MSFFISEELKEKINIDDVRKEENEAVSSFYFKIHQENFYFDLLSIKRKNSTLTMVIKTSLYDPMFLIDPKSEIAVYNKNKKLGYMIDNDICIEKKKSHYKIKFKVTVC